MLLEESLVNSDSRIIIIQYVHVLVSIFYYEPEYYS